MSKNDKKEKKEKKVIKIGKLTTSVGELILFAFMLISLILVYTSPKTALIVTPKYNQETAQDKDVITALGEENTEYNFKLYFWWYNVIHEIGHGVKDHNGNKNISGAEEEQLVNDFAYAYWSYLGQQDKLDEVEQIINYAVEHVQNDENSNVNYMEYAKSNWNKKTFLTFNNYGYFQFNSVKETFKNKKSLAEVLKEMGVNNANLSNTKMVSYDNIDEQTCDKIINDTIDNIHAWGLKFSNTIHKYSTDAFDSYYRSNRKAYIYMELLFNNKLR